MNRLSLSQLLYSAFALLVAMLLACAGMSWQLAATSKRSIELENAATRGTAALADAQAAMWELRWGVAYYLSNPGADKRAKVVADAAGVRAAFDKAMNDFESTHNNPATQAKLTELRPIFATYADARAEMFKLFQDGKEDEANDVRAKRGTPAGSALTNAFSELVELQRADIDARSAASSQALARARIAVLVVAIVGVLAAIAAALWVVRRTMRQLGGDPVVVTAIVRRIADGDLNSSVPAGVAAHSVLAAMGEMQDRLRKLVLQVEASSDSIATGSAQIASGNADLSHRTEEQAGHVQQTASAMTQLTTTVQHNADAARQAAQLAGDARSVAERGGQVVGQVVATMSDISTSSKRIGDIIGVIDGIAFQTNILALNAAVEAARAGEQGRGFAVVASEVRALAQRSAGAAREIKALIGASVERVETGSAQVHAAGRTMQEIVRQIQRVNELVSEITTASQEQSLGIARVGDAMTQIDQTTQQNSALVEQSAAAAESLREQAATLVSALSGFKRVAA